MRPRMQHNLHAHSWKIKNSPCTSVPERTKANEYE